MEIARYFGSWRHDCFVLYNIAINPDFIYDVRIKAKKEFFE